jgi:hypothetical protein
MKYRDALLRPNNASAYLRRFAVIVYRPEEKQAISRIFKLLSKPEF